MNSQLITITDRKEISLTNVNNVTSFNESEFLVDTPLGNLKITGKNLTIGKMDTDKKDLIIKGSIDSINYLKLFVRNSSILIMHSFLRSG